MDIIDNRSEVVSDQEVIDVDPEVICYDNEPHDLKISALGLNDHDDLTGDLNTGEFRLKFGIQWKLMTNNQDQKRKRSNNVNKIYLG